LHFPLELGLMNGRSDLSHRDPVMLNRAILAAVAVAWSIATLGHGLATALVSLVLIEASSYGTPLLSVKEAIENYLRAHKEAVKILQSVHSMEGAKSALRRLDAVKARCQYDESLAVVAKATTEEVAKAREPFGADYRWLGQATQDEYFRIAKINGALQQLSSTFPISELDEIKRTIARIEIQYIEGVIGVFRKYRGRLPASLEELTRVDEPGGTPMLAESVLVDPWRRPYQFDNSGRRNLGRKPDVWSKGPLSKPGSEIGNW